MMSFLALFLAGNVDTITIDQLLLDVKEHAPALASARATFGVTKADETNADVWPNPSASYGFSGTAFGADALNGQQHAIDVGVPLLIAGQGGARLEAARAATHAAEADLYGAAADLEHDVRQAFEDLLVAQSRVDVAKAALDELLEAERIVDARAANGAGSKYDALRIAAAVAAGQASLGDEQQKLIAAQASLATIAGKPGWQPHAEGELTASAVPSTTFTPEKLWAVEGATRRIEAAKRQLTKAEREAWPTPSVSVGTVLWPGATLNPASKAAGGAGGAVVAGLGSDIPIFDRNQTAIAHAHAAVTEAEALRSQALVEAQSTYQTSLVAAKKAEDVLQQFDAKTGGESIKSLRGMARDGYQASKVSILDLVDALSAIVTVEMQHIDLVENTKKTQLDLQRAAGALGDAVLPPG
jgi:cobalt-zinc-cadmium efflux system outer membrane protein